MFETTSQLFGDRRFCSALFFNSKKSSLRLTWVETEKHWTCDRLKSKDLSSVRGEKVHIESDKSCSAPGSSVETLRIHGLDLNSLESCWFPGVKHLSILYEGSKCKCILPPLHLVAVFFFFFFLGTIHLYEDTRGFVPLERDLALSIGIKNKSLLALPSEYYIFPARLPITSLITAC